MPSPIREWAGRIWKSLQPLANRQMTLEEFTLVTRQLYPFPCGHELTEAKKQSISGELKKEPLREFYQGQEWIEFDPNWKQVSPSPLTYEVGELRFGWKCCQEVNLKVVIHLSQKKLTMKVTSEVDGEEPYLPQIYEVTKEEKGNISFDLTN
ncbi:hypothetical protein SAMN05444392_101550 [Seinonella peptonophila]|uniref:Uncharacterized protein n=1 Tax=Seinonella peptonophila TaxID=112248 RepID=A0A1M4TN97_9BACL|nr:hypothetical protein [Seinonella peptonophila]SHE45864.1 hypothetical protein SAMN05444392_101550 [Seinonella peptonophila]